MYTGKVHLDSYLISVTRCAVTPGMDDTVTIAIALEQNGPNVGLVC